MTEELSVELSLEVTYVYGVVNGEEATFSLTSPGIWSAIVPKSPDGKYVIDITAYNELGSYSTHHIVMYKLEDLITPVLDWKADDFYHADDLNRVEANAQYVADCIRALGFSIPDMTFRVDRDMTSVDYISSINRVEDNLETIRSNFITPPGYKEKETWAVNKGFSYKDANRWEYNIKLLYDWIIIAKENFIYCGTFYCGEDGEV